MPEDVWYFVDRGERVGPVSLMRLKAIILRLPDSEHLLVWREGLPDWTLAEETQELRSVRPPPIPESHRAKPKHQTVPPAEPQPEWRIRWWWYFVAVLFFGSIGSQDGRRAMAWASAERERRRRFGRVAAQGAAETLGQQRAGLSKIFVREFRNPALFAASSIYGLYLGMQKPPIIAGLAAGAVGGIVLVGIAEALAWLIRLFREKLPRAAFYTGTIAFWLGIAVAIWCIGLCFYLAYEQAPISLVSIFAGCAVFYGALGWGLRDALSR